MADRVRRFELRPTFVRSLGYGTGVPLGLLLDQYEPSWRRRVSTKGFGGQLTQRLLSAKVNRNDAELAAMRYDGKALAAEEDARDAAQQRRLSDYRARLVEGPTLVLRQQGLGRSFNPNELIAFGELGTIYPTGSFSAEWGSLQLESGGALVSEDYHTLRVPLPADSSARTVTGKGWVLNLSPGWHIQPAERPGDWTAVH